MAGASRAALAAFFGAVSKRDLDALGELLDADTVFLFPKTDALRGAERIQRFFRVLFHRYPRLDFELLDTVIEGDRAAAHWRNAGEARDGSPYANEGVTWFRFEGGRLVLISDFFKDTERF